MYFSLKSSIVDERKECLQRDLNTQPKKVFFFFQKKKRKTLFSHRPSSQVEKFTTTGTKNALMRFGLASAHKYWTCLKE